MGHSLYKALSALGITRTPRDRAIKNSTEETKEASRYFSAILDGSAPCSPHNAGFEE